MIAILSNLSLKLETEVLKVDASVAALAVKELVMIGSIIQAILLASVASF